MKHNALISAAFWPFVAVPTLLLLVFGLFQWRAVEQDVAAQAQQVLDSDNFEWTTVESFNRGRDVLITGIAPDTDSATLAVQLARQAVGVRRAEFAGDIALVQDSSKLAAEWSAGQLILTGQLQSRTVIDAIVADAITVHGAGQVVNRLTVGEHLNPIPSLHGLFDAVSVLGDGDSMAIEDDEVILTGDVESAAIRAALDRQIAEIFPVKVSNQLTISAPPVVENNECQQQVGALLNQANINFEVSKAVIGSDSFGVLAEVAQTAKRCPEAQFEVSGHTDSIGNEALNIALSEQRAQAVVDHLIGLDLDSGRFTVQGYGSSQPIESNQTAAGRSRNRRIEFNIRDQ